MGAAALIALFWIAFAGTHVWLSSRAMRARLLARLGAGGFQGLYSLVALVTFVPLVWVYTTHKHAGPLLWMTVGPPAFARAANYALMAVAFALFICSLVPAASAPSAMQARGPVVARGITRVTRHPMLAAFGLFGAAHLLVNGSLGDVLFFGGFPLFTWIGGRHQDARKADALAGYAGLVDATSVLPFAAILAGRQRLVLRELPLAALATGVVLAVVIRSYHDALFGP